MYCSPAQHKYGCAEMQWKTYARQVSFPPKNVSSHGKKVLKIRHSANGIEEKASKMGKCCVRYAIGCQLTSISTLVDDKDFRVLTCPRAAAKHVSYRKLKGIRRTL